MPHDLRPSLPLIRAVFDRNLALLARIVDGIDDEAARVPLIEGGSHLHWLLGHLVASRDGLLGHIGAERVWDLASAEAYGCGSGPDAPVVATIEEPLAASSRPASTRRSARSTMMRWPATPGA